MAVDDLAYSDVRALRIPWRRILVGVGVAVGLVGGGFVTTNTYSLLWQRHLEGQWATVLASGTASTSAMGDPVAKIIIPDLGLERVVVEGVGGSALRKGPGHLPGSSLPGELGNSVVRGHRLLWSGPFRNLDRLDYGSRILVQTQGGTAVYLVAGVFQLDEDRTDFYEDTVLPYLTLVTSDPPFRANRMLVIRAVMVERNGEPI
ncbi:MAG: sortase [Actinomycetota bacterium]